MSEASRPGAYSGDTAAPAPHTTFYTYPGSSQFNAPGGTQNFRIHPDQLPALMAAATLPLERQNADAQAEMRSLGERLGASEGIVRAVLASLAEHGRDLAPDALPAKVADLVRERQDLLARQQDREPDPDAALAELDRQLAECLRTGDDAAAQSLLERKKSLKLAAAQHRRQATERLQDAESRDLADAAEAEASLGDLARARLDYYAAAHHFRSALAVLPSSEANRNARLSFLYHAADALYRQGNELGDNSALAASIDAWRDLLAELPRERAPLDWAMAQHNLGNALMALGEREADTVRLMEAVEAYHAALEEWPRERAPLEWGRIQDHLGCVLTVLGERDSNTACLRDAASVFYAALEELTRERVPLEWAATKSNLGNVLVRLGERENDTERFEQAVVAFRAALEERTRARVPLDWASTQSNLGNALVRLGQREKDTARLVEAVACYRGALEEWTRERRPLLWATAQNNLGNALRFLGARQKDAALLEDAVAAFHAAREEWTLERVPLDWAAVTENLGIAFGVLGEWDIGKARLEEAAAAFCAALDVFHTAGDPRAASAGRNLQRAETLLAERRSG
jgi:tetratricopeptide (TPR) repeat protein